MKVRRLDKMPKRKVTIDDLLVLDTVKEIIGDLDADKSDIEELVVIFSKRNDKNFTFMINGLPESRVVYMCEMVKYTLLQGKTKEE